MSAARQKGTAWETLICRVLNGFFLGRYGLRARRVAQEGFADTGDVHGVSPFIVQAKAYKSLADALRIGVSGAVVQAERAGEMYGVAVIKKPHASAGEAYAALRLQDFARVLLRLRRAEALLAQHAPLAYTDHMVDTVADNTTAFPKA